MMKNQNLRTMVVINLIILFVVTSYTPGTKGSTNFVQVKDLTLPNMGADDSMGLKKNILLHSSTTSANTPPMVTINFAGNPNDMGEPWLENPTHELVTDNSIPKSSQN